MFVPLVIDSLLEFAEPPSKYLPSLAKLTSISADEVIPSVSVIPVTSIPPATVSSFVVPLCFKVTVLELIARFVFVPVVILKLSLLGKPKYESVFPVCVMYSSKVIDGTAIELVAVKVATSKSASA